MVSKKWVAILLSLLLAVILVAGCSGTGGDNEIAATNDIAKTNEGTSADDSSESTPSYQVSPSPLDLTIHMHYFDSTVFDEEWAVFKKAAELTKVKLKGTAPKTASNSAEIFNLMMVSGEMSDIVLTNKINIHKFGIEGAFIPIEGLIAEHAPNIKKFLDDNPEVIKSSKAPDGKLYHIPFLPDGEAAAGWFIRKDWLDKLKLEVPDTVDEFYVVLKAFRDLDPNGNNKKDEVPLFFRGDVMKLVSFWEATPDWTVADGKAVWGPTRPQFKTAVSNIAKWYKEGLIDKEVFTRKGKARDELLGNNVGGSTNDWFASTATYNDSLKETVPGLEFIAIAPPKNVNGQRVELSSREQVSFENGWGISHSNPNPVETIKYFDFWFTEEGRRLANFGVEGQTYNLVDGKPRFTDKILTGNVLTNLNEYGVQLQFGFKQDFEYEKQWMNEIALQGAEMYIENDYFAEKFPQVTFTTEEQNRLDQIRPAITTFYGESVQKWILGAEDPATGYDRFLNTLKSMGIDDMTAIYQNAFDRYNQ